MKDIWVVICGLVRKPSYLEEAIVQLVNARERGLIRGIIYSTWIGEIDRYENLREHLTNHRINIIESTEPQTDEMKIAGSGNAAMQKIALRQALDTVPERSYIYKTRPDQALNTTEKLLKLIQFFIDTDFEVAAQFKYVLPFKIWSGWANPDVPFFIDDRNFFSHLDVVRRMCALRFEIGALTTSGNNIAEINWFAPLFYDQFDVIRRFFIIDWLKLIFGLTSELNLEYQELIKGTDLFWIGIALYYMILEEYFILGSDLFELADYKFLGEDSLRIYEIPRACADVLESRQPHQADERFWQARAKVADMKWGHVTEGDSDEGIENYLAHAPRFGINLRTKRITDNDQRQEPSTDALSALSRNIRIKARTPTTALDDQYRENISLQLFTQKEVRLYSHFPAYVEIMDMNSRDLIWDTSKPLFLAYQWHSVAGPLWLEFPRIPIKNYQRPKTIVSFSLLAPQTPGIFVLHVDLILEGVAWFGRGTHCEVTVF